MTSSGAIDIGFCVNNVDSKLERLTCLGKDNLNFCCRLTNSSNLIADTGQRICCSGDQYDDQNWVSLAYIQGYSITLHVLFVYLCIIVGWFVATGCMIHETDVKESRQRIIRHLLKRQVLYKSPRSEPTMYDSLKRISSTLSSSIRKNKNKNKKYPPVGKKVALDKTARLAKKSMNEAKTIRSMTGPEKENNKPNIPKSIMSPTKTTEQQTAKKINQNLVQTSWCWCDSGLRLYSWRYLFNFKFITHVTIYNSRRIFRLYSYSFDIF